MTQFHQVTVGPHRLYLGDAYQILPTLGRFDAFVSDPPYLFDTSGGGEFKKNRKKINQIAEEGLDQGFDHKIINPLLYPCAVVFCHNDQLDELLPYLAGSYRRFCLCGWEKENPLPMANKHYAPDLEPYIHAWHENAHPVGDLKDKRRIWRGPNGKSEHDHPTVKPVQLMEKIMRNVNGASVVDPFMGTATTGVAAIKYGKTFTGIEINPKHFETAVRRMEIAYGG